VSWKSATTNRSLTYCWHLESRRKRLMSRIAHVRRFASSGWGSGATTLRTDTVALVHSTAEHCALAGCRCVHNRLIDSGNNDALRIVTGCLRPTPVDNLPILASIQTAELRRKRETLSLARRAMEPGHLLHSALTCLPCGNTRRLEFRHPFVPAAQLISSSDQNRRQRAFNRGSLRLYRWFWHSKNWRNSTGL